MEAILSKKCFEFNINKCVGCHACVVACSIENKTVPDIQWRGITSINPTGFPDIPLLHLSLACNHCTDAPCMKNCPALAYSYDKISGAVIHHAEKCIGCKYCTWACPYDAPKFNIKSRIIEKCTFCYNRINELLKPACANLCPTGALDFIDAPEDIEYSGIIGFTDTGIKPSIKIIPRQKGNPVLVCSEPQFIESHKVAKKTTSKISLSHEWPLAFFTLLAVLLVSFFTASTFGKIGIDHIVFIVSGISGMLLSLFHLGKKFRAWRSILNLKNSWLSREIFFYMLFFGMACLNLLFINEKFIAYFAIIFGALALFSIDKVYELAMQPVKLDIHSAHVLLSFFLFTALFLEQYLAFTFIVILKASIYIYRKFEMRKNKINIRLLLSSWRLDMLISVPVLLWIFGISNIRWWLFASVLIGEIIDRAEYYDELDIITPEKQVGIDLKKMDNRL
jgi:Fe-S-cluster-containing dehydrogenase component/DMSO reductase anchor subunit